MLKIKRNLSLLGFFAIVGLQAQDTEYFELRTYENHTVSQQRATEQLLLKAVVPALKRHGLTRIGVFREHDRDLVASHDIFLVVPYTSWEQLGRVKNELRNDTVFQQDLQKWDAPGYRTDKSTTYDRLTTTLLRAFSEMPELSPTPLTGPLKDRVYELRSYESANEPLFKNKVEMFNEGGEVTLFHRIGSNAVFYGEVIAGDAMPNLMYMTTYTDKSSRDAHWDTFGKAPEWVKLTENPYFDKNVSHIDIRFLYPTEFSDY